MEKRESILDKPQKKETDERIQAIQTMYETTTGLNFKTDLDEREIEAIVQIDLINEYIKKEWEIELSLKNITQYYKELKVSHKRQGRSEFVEMMKTFLVDTLGNDKRSIRGLLGIGQ